MRVRLKIFKASSQPVVKDESKCFIVDVLDEIIEDALLDILNKDSLETCLFYGDLGLFDLGSTMDEMDYR